MVKTYEYRRMENDQTYQNKRIIIYCRSISALNLYKEMYNKGLNVIGFSDSFCDKDEEFCGLPCYTPEHLRELGDIAVCVATKNPKYEREILQRLFELRNATIYAYGIIYGPGLYDINKMRVLINKDEEIIKSVYSYLCDEQSVKTFSNLIEYRKTNNSQLINEIFEMGHQQYFPRDMFQIEKNAVFVDAGAYDGMTSVAFSKWCDTYGKIYCLEPDSLMYKVMHEVLKIKGIKNVVEIEKGAWLSNGKFKFSMNNMTGSSFLDDKGSYEIETTTIDSILSGTKASYIKMDIEGAELEALKGCRETIIKYKPVLAISVYHKPDDLWILPYYIKKNYPWYKLYMRHYTDLTTETILYAVAENEM